MKKVRLLKEADKAEAFADRSNEPSVKDTMLTLAALYRDLAIQIDELGNLRARLRQRH
jgi:hypothetical protein